MSSIIFALMSLFSGVAHAETVLVSDLVVTTHALIQTDERSYEIHFSIENGEYLQPGIEYGVILIDKDGEVAAGEYSEETLLLLPEEERTTFVRYTAPENLGGVFDVFISVHSQTGFPFAFIPVGEVSLEGIASSTAFSVLKTNIIESIRVAPRGVYVYATVTEPSTVSVRVCGEEYMVNMALQDPFVFIESEVCGEHVGIEIIGGSGEIVDKEVFVIGERVKKSLVYPVVAVCIGVLSLGLLLLRKRNKVMTLVILGMMFLGGAGSVDAAVYKETFGFNVGSGPMSNIGCNVTVRVIGPEGVVPQGSNARVTYSYQTTDCTLAYFTGMARLTATGPRVDGPDIGDGTGNSAGITLTLPNTPGAYDIYASGKLNINRTASREKTYPSTHEANPMFQITVPTPKPKPSVSLSISKARSGASFISPERAYAGGSLSIEKEESVTLSWDSEHAAGCSGSPSVFDTDGKKDGNVVLTPNKGTQYTVTCWNDVNDRVSDTATVTVTVPPEDPTPPKEIYASFSASPTSVPVGGEVLLEWGSEGDVDRCVGWNFGTGKAPSGTKVVSVPAGGATYGVTCWDSPGTEGNKATASQYVSTYTVTPPEPPTPPIEPVPEPEPEPTSPPTLHPWAHIEVRNLTQGGDWISTTGFEIQAGDQIGLKWESEDADSCGGSYFSTYGATYGETSSVTEPGIGETIGYRVVCGGASDLVRVTMLANKPLLTASTRYVREGESLVLEYNLNGNTRSGCRLSGPGMSVIPASQSGTLSVPVYGDSTFTVSCAGGEHSVQVELIPVVFDS